MATKKAAKHVLSAEGRQRIIDAQKARWAGKTAKKVTAKKKAKKAEPEVFPQVPGRNLVFDRPAVEAENQKQNAEQSITTDGMFDNRLNALDQRANANQDRYEDAESALIREMKYHELRAQEIRFYLQQRGYGFD
jgi:hypothetical protein